MLSLHQLIGALAFVLFVSSVVAGDSAAGQLHGQHSACFTLTNGGKTIGKGTLRKLSLSKRSESYLIKRHKKKKTAKSGTSVKPAPVQSTPATSHTQVCGSTYKSSDDVVCLPTGWLSSDFTNNCNKQVKITANGHSVYGIALGSCSAPANLAGCDTITVTPSLYSKLGGGGGSVTWEFANGDQV